MIFSLRLCRFPARRRRRWSRTRNGHCVFSFHGGALSVSSCPLRLPDGQGKCPIHSHSPSLPYLVTEPAQPCICQGLDCKGLLHLYEIYLIDLQPVLLRALETATGTAGYVNVGSVAAIAHERKYAIGLIPSSVALLSDARTTTEAPSFSEENYRQYTPRRITGRSPASFPWSFRGAVPHLYGKI